MEQETLLQQYQSYLGLWTANGGHTLTLVTPCCGRSLDTPAPPAGETWDSLVTCPYCTDSFMKIVTHTKAEGRQPPGWRR